MLKGEEEKHVAELEGQIGELRDNGKFAEAIPLAEKVAKTRTAIQGADHWEVIDARWVLSDLQLLAELPMAQRDELMNADRATEEVQAHFDACNYEKAERRLQRQLVTFRQLLGNVHPVVAQCLNDLAIVRQTIGQPVEAKALYASALEIRRRLFTSDHPDLATSMTCFADVYMVLGQAADAEPLFLGALEMRRRLFQGDHPDVAQSLNDMARLRYVCGQAAVAEPLFLEVLKMRQRLFSGDHSDVANSLNNFAAVCQELGKLAEAESMYVEALAMCRRLFNGDNPYLAISVNNLASVRHELGRLAEAEPLYVETLEMRQRLFKRDHLEVASSLGNLAMVHNDLGRCAEAEALQVQSLEMFLRLFKGDHPYVALGLDNLATVREDLGRTTEAETLFAQALEMRQRLLKGDHPFLVSSLNNLASARLQLGKLSDAEPLCVGALEMSQRLFNGDHPKVAHTMNRLAVVRQALKRPSEAEPLYRQSFEMSERLRTQTTGGAEQRAAFAQELSLSQRAFGLAGVLLELHRGAEALAILERGRARAALDLLAQSGRDLPAEARALGDPERAKRLEAAQADEDQARTALASAELLLAGTSKQRTSTESRGDLATDAKAKQLAEFDQQIAKLTDDVKDKRAVLTQAGAAVLVELRGLFPAAKAMTLEKILAGLSPDEAVVSFGWGEESVLVAVAGNGQSSAELIAEGKEAVAKLAEQVKHLRASIAQRPGDGPAFDPGTARELLAALLPESIRQRIRYARRLIVLPDGPLNEVPLEALLVAEPNDSVLSNKAIAYAPSATVYLDRKRRAQDDNTKSVHSTTAVVLGDPDFAQPQSEPIYPKQGVLLAAAMEGDNAAKAGLRRGDILLRYAGQTLTGPEALGPAIQRAAAAATQPAASDRSHDASKPQRVAVTYWRDGKEAEIELPVGKLGVQIEPGDPGEKLRAIKVLDQITRGGGEEFSAGVSATEQVRLFGGVLPALPGTGREARAIAGLFKTPSQPATLLTGPDASMPKLWTAVTNSPPRYLHLATHGLTGSADRPLEASLALTQPDKPTPEDVGFLRLEDLLARWGGRLNGCKLVVLSACDTQRGVRKGDTAMSLPLGFFYAGAETVVASLWKVDDDATGLLMSRMYENLLGQHDEARPWRGRSFGSGQSMSKLEALDEAKAWLRTLTVQQKDAALARLRTAASPAFAAASDAQRGPGKAQPARTPGPQASHPYGHPFYWAAFVLVGSPE